jgi:hypothetical protein
MKTLSIKQPWAHLIASGIKNIENRTWQTKYRGRIYIHASQKPSFNNLTLNLSHDQIDEIVMSKLYFPWDARSESYSKGAIIGEVDIVDCVQNHESVWAEKSYFPANFNSLPFGEEDEKPTIIWNWVLANPVLYDQPILNVKGALSLWDYEKPYEVVGSAELITL